MSDDHSGNCINSKLNQQLDYIKLQLENKYEALKTCWFMLTTSWFVIFVLVYFLYNIHKEYRAFHNQAIKYGWIEQGFQGKYYTQIKLDKMKPIVTSQDKPLTVHFVGEVLDQMNQWHKFHIVIEPNWETKED